MIIEHDYFYGEEAEQFAFYRIPSVIYLFVIPPEYIAVTAFVELFAASISSSR